MWYTVSVVHGDTTHKSAEYTTKHSIHVNMLDENQYVHVEKAQSMHMCFST